MVHTSLVSVQVSESERATGASEDCVCRYGAVCRAAPIAKACAPHSSMMAERSGTCPWR